MTEAEARALLDTWLNAQNAGDFAAYRQLYAERFDGIKRLGERVRKLNRAAWLVHREREVNCWCKPSATRTRSASPPCAI